MPRQKLVRVEDREKQMERWGEGKKPMIRSVKAEWASLMRGPESNDHSS